MFTEFGAIISSNGPSKISVSEVADHTLMPEYPATSATGIVHFIHSENPIKDYTDLSLIRDVFTTQMSKVSICLPITYQAYAIVDSVLRPCYDGR
jgi:hypothetical protein